MLASAKVASLLPEPMSPWTSATWRGKRFAAAGTDIYWSGPAEFDAFVKSELVKWTAAIKEAGIEPE